jgi:peptidyl-prolyl cis-trans isomerase B (cyclophilin B)
MAYDGPDTNVFLFYVKTDTLSQEQVKMLDGTFSKFCQVTRGLDIATKIGKGDQIQSIDVLDSTEDLFAAQQARLTEWNKILDQKFGKRLTSAPTG